MLIPIIAVLFGCLCCAIAVKLVFFKPKDDGPTFYHPIMEEDYDC